MKAMFIVGCAIFLCHSLNAQDTVLKKNYFIKARILDKSGDMRVYYLANITDSAVVLSPTPASFRRGLSSMTTVNYQQIDIAIIKRRGSVGRGILIGSIAGIVAGGITGGITYKKCDDCIWDFGVGPHIAAGSILGVGSGALIGAIVGALAEKRFIIGGNKQKFDKLRLSVLDMAYRAPATRY